MTESRPVSGEQEGRGGGEHWVLGEEQELTVTRGGNVPCHEQIICPDVTKNTGLVDVPCSAQSRLSGVRIKDSGGAEQRKDPGVSHILPHFPDQHFAESLVRPCSPCEVQQVHNTTHMLRGL